MIVKVSPSSIGGKVKAPPSKSSMQRAIAAALLSNGSSIISNPSFSDDSVSALNMAEILGASVKKFNDKVVIKGGVNPGSNTLNCGESGLGIRLFSAIAALHDQEITLSGTGSILRRPMDMIVDTLKQLGVDVTSSDGRLPISVKGPIVGGEAMVDGSVSSQFLTGLLFALPLAVQDSRLTVLSLKSKPYIDLTIKVLNSFGILIENREYQEFIIRGGQKYKATNYIVEEDWSGIAFLGVLGAISGDLSVTNISADSVQADRRIIDVLKSCGSNTEITGNILNIRKTDLKPFEFDISDCPDLAPPLVALATFCNGESVIKGAKRLASKESNRSKTLFEEFRKIGGVVSLFSDEIRVQGNSPLYSGKVSSHGDHRISMALAIAATRADGPIFINGAESVNKSYPGFFNDLISLGGEVEFINE